ncbi:SPX domain-containing protein [Plasmodiophora brassicae]|uniref:SPX domain-containing protein n=1 Tax=Plasmodiophora brassicae TaxID=37360 RepID=A0A3P3Y787_PLABS|nr:unnamed protein product [Plasmodiophora brassicae]
MKFGKSIRLEANLPWNTKWADYYLNYKKFKQLIHQLAQLGHDQEDKLNQVLLEAKSLLERSVSVTNFESESEAEIERKTTEERRDSAVRHASEIKLKFEATGDFRRRCFQELFRREFNKIDQFCSNQAASIRKRILTDTNQVSSQDLRKSLLGFTLQLIRLEHFISMNFSGLDKIVKKYDKVMRGRETDPAQYKDLLAETSARVASRRQSHVNAVNEVRALVAEEMVKCGPISTVEEDEAAQKELDETIVEDDIPVFTSLNIETLPPASVTRMKIVLGTDGLGFNLTVPVIVAKGAFEGPVLGITSAVHGNELNGIPLIFRLLRELDVETLNGTVAAVPVLNCPGLLMHQRNFHDGQDLNRLFPGNPNGNCGQVYAYNIVNSIICKFNYHIDLHTASFGRVNSLYVRADMNNRITHSMALLQEPQIIVHNTAPDGSLRSAAMNLGIPSITVEIGDPSRIHRRFVTAALLGVENILSSLHMVIREDQEGPSEDSKPTVCARSFWIFAKHGGLLTVTPEINTWVEKGQVIAQIRNIFGDITATYRAPLDGIVVGKSVDPVCSTGDRVLHLGIVESSFPAVARDGHT